MLLVGIHRERGPYAKLILFAKIEDPTQCCFLRLFPFRRETQPYECCFPSAEKTPHGMFVLFSLRKKTYVIVLLYFDNERGPYAIVLCRSRRERGPYAIFFAQKDDLMQCCILRKSRTLCNVLVISLAKKEHLVPFCLHKKMGPYAILFLYCLQRKRT